MPHVQIISRDYGYDVKITTDVGNFYFSDVELSIVRAASFEGAPLEETDEFEIACQYQKYQKLELEDE